MRALFSPSARWLITLALLLVLMAMLFPFFVIGRDAFTIADRTGAAHLSMRNWHVLFAHLPVLRQLVNSTIVTLGSVLLILAVSSLAAFALTKLRVRHGGVMLAAVAASMMIPMQSIILSEFVNFAAWDLSGNFLAVMITYAALGVPFGTFLMTSFMRDIPDELVEAAHIDGMSYWGMFLRVILPLSVPALLAVAVLQFIQIWDDLLVALIFLQQPMTRTITVGLAVLQSGRVLDVPVLLAGSLLSAAPAMLVYLVFQRYLIGGLMLGVGK